MELQMKYQYTNFIYPYVIEKNNYQKYISKLTKNKNCEIINWKKDKDLDLYNFFLPEIRKYIFNNFQNTKPISKENNILFNYKLEKDIQGKIGKENGIFFQIQKIHILCFKSGLCFLIIKTNVENSKNFSDILNFNYKFRDINSDYNLLKEYENIKIQTDKFENMKELTDFINELTDNAGKNNKIDTNRFYTYSYVCLEQESWKEETLENEFTKFSNILPSSYNINNNIENTKIITNTKYSKIGITENGVTLLCSSTDTKNYTTLLENYDNEYLYLYIISLYEKLYSKQIMLNLKNNQKNARDEYVKLKQELITNNITNDEFGNSLNTEFRNVLKLNEIEEEIIKIFDIECKKLDIEKTKKANKIILIILLASLTLNIINFIAMMYYR